MEQFVAVDASILKDSRLGEHGFNVSPSGFREIHYQEYAAKISQLVPVFSEFRQILRDQSGKEFPRMIEGRLMFFGDGTGVLEEHYYTKLINGRYGYEPRYYRFGCEHKHEQIGTSWPRCSICGQLSLLHHGD
jgi:hypothetical protein